MINQTYNYSNYNRCKYNNRQWNFYRFIIKKGNSYKRVIIYCKNKNKYYKYNEYYKINNF